MSGWKNLIAVGLGVVGVWLLMIQIDALSGHQPRFGIWAKEYLSDTKLLNDRNTGGMIPSRDEISKSPAMEYNYATMLALHGERAGLPEAVTYWEQSIEQYESILAQEENSFAQTNAQILQNLLDEFTQEQENNQQEQQDQLASGEEGSEDQGTQDGSQSPTEEGSQQDQQNGQPSGEEQGSQGEDPQESGLSQEQLQQLQDYQQQLQQQQFQNQQYFGKQPQNQPPSSIFDQFFGDPQFRQDQSGDEKDW